MKAKVSWMCSKCGKKFHAGNTNGLPNGIGFVQKDGTIINLCQQCIIDAGKEKEDKKDV